MSTRAFVAFLPLWVVTSVGCASTTQSARFSRAPVMVGPVPCVGCAARKEKPKGDPAFIDESGISSWAFSTGFTTHSGFSIDPSKLNEKTASVVDPCRAEVALREIRASAFGLWPLVVLYESSSTYLAGDFRAVPNGSCDMTIERWPLSGPQGISWPYVKPPAPPTVPNPPPPLPPPTAPGATPDASTGGDT
jgi:hypothetical protein